MAQTMVEVKKAEPATRVGAPDPRRSLRGEMEELLNQFSGEFGFPSTRRMFGMLPSWRYAPPLRLATPAIDVAEDQGAYTITAEVPGLEDKDIDVALSNGMLTLKGEKRHEKEEKRRNYTISERSYGRFERRFALPDGVDQEKITARFSKGVLTLTLPKTAEAKKQPKKIEVKAG